MVAGGPDPTLRRAGGTTVNQRRDPSTRAEAPPGGRPRAVARQSIYGGVVAARGTRVVRTAILATGIGVGRARGSGQAGADRSGGIGAKALGTAELDRDMGTNTTTGTPARGMTS